MILSWGRDYDFGPWGNPVLTDLVSSKVAFDISRCDFDRGVFLDTDKLTGTYRSIVRTVGGMYSWGPAEVLIVGAATGVKIRATDGVTDYWFRSGAWAPAVASTDWNAPADLYSAMPFWTKKPLGFVVKLSRSSASHDSPILMGINAVVRVLFMQTASEPLRASSWQDDVLTRVLMTQLATIRLSGVQEITIAAGDVASLSFAAGVAELPHNVTAIEAVFNRTTWVEIPGTFNPTTKIWTPTAPMTVGTQVHVRYAFRPSVVHTGDADYISITQPEILVESVSETGGRRIVAYPAVRSLSSHGAVSVKGPTSYQYLFGIRVLAARATERDRLMSEMHRLFEVRKTFLSPTTSLPVEIWLVDGSMETGNIIGDGFDMRLTLAADTECWHGEESIRATTADDGFTPSVA